MPIQEGDFIKISYTGRLGESVFDTTDADLAKEEGIHNPAALYGPITIRVGSRHVIPGLEEALIGKEIGYEGDTEVAPELGFGPHDESLVKSVPVTQFREKPKVGTRVEMDNREGVVVNVIGRRALVDFNHPLAGKTLHYHFAIEERVEDAQERIQGLIRLYAGRDDVEIAINGGTVEMLLPPGITYDRRWMLWRGRIVHEIFEYLDGIDEIIFKEAFRRPAQPEEEAAGEEPAPAEE
ncbi:MAG: peptidylprolyl isomerase [Methanomicrobiaceae archaeon]|uniref:peptidylprolyl isomerase n=1 Tax=hydrocarbon metagenome TaxID=938273 RepID=A0A0W8FJ90_9ZZZZ|nr:peptidylprolyl isomerase [Methanomicrobiaceae archaeon]MDD5418957.1 FKBP-type peptidyl-prolyl cis-trans isomerase [Methanomicrobiaceae archaeon]